MDEDEDDFYDPADSVPVTQSQNAGQNVPTDAQANEGDEEEIEVEEDDVRSPFLFSLSGGGFGLCCLLGRFQHYYRGAAGCAAGRGVSFDVSFLVCAHRAY